MLVEGGDVLDPLPCNPDVGKIVRPVTVSGGMYKIGDFRRFVAEHASADEVCRENVR
jgi:hypothetical protein